MTCQKCIALIVSNPAEMSTESLQMSASAEYQGVTLCPLHAAAGDLKRSAVRLCDAVVSYGIHRGTEDDKWMPSLSELIQATRETQEAIRKATQ